MGWLTAFMSNTTMALVEDGTLLGPRRFDMGNSGIIATVPGYTGILFGMGITNVVRADE